MQQQKPNAAKNKLNLLKNETQKIRMLQQLAIHMQKNHSKWIIDLNIKP